MPNGEHCHTAGSGMPQVVGDIKVTSLRLGGFSEREAEAGHLIVFDRARDRTWAQKIFRRAPSGAGVPVTVWGM